MPCFSNQATLTYRNCVATSNVVSGEIHDALTAAKTAVSGDYCPGGSLTYAISIVNAGCTCYNCLSVVDDLGAYAACGQTLTPLEYVPGTLRYFVGGVMQPCPQADTDCALTITGIDVPGNSNVLILYTVRVNQYAPMGKDACITNTAVIGRGTLLSPITVCATVQAEQELRLCIRKAISPSAVIADEPMTYTFTIENAGAVPAVATDDVVVTDWFDPALDIKCVTLNGQELQPDCDYTYDRATGAFSSAPSVITVPAACFHQDADSGCWLAEPGCAVLKVTGTVCG